MKKKVKQKKQPEKKLYKLLDILKFICSILIACMYHYRNDFPGMFPLENIPGIKQISIHGWLLVELFFILSGFFFFNSYYDKIVKKKENIKTFFKKRFIRLIPVAAITSIIMFILQQVYIKLNGVYWMWEANDLSDLLLQVSGFQFWLNTKSLSLNNAVWYVSVLLLCYVVYYYVVKFAAKKKNKLFILLPVILTFIVQNYQLNIPLLNWNVQRGIISFGIGIFLGYIISKQKSINKLSIISLICLILSGVLYLTIGLEQIGDLTLVLNIIVYPSIIILLIKLEEFINFIKPNVSRFLANISFGIYLWNLPIQLLTIIISQVFKLKFNYGSIIFLIIQILIHIFVAILSFYLIEKKLVRRLETKISTMN